MNAPPVQYTRTSDAYSIAYMVSGQGPTVIVLPQLFQHAQRIWAGGPIARLVHSLAESCRVVQDDSRGQGMSQRGLTAPIGWQITSLTSRRLPGPLARG